MKKSLLILVITVLLCTNCNAKETDGISAGSAIMGVPSLVGHMVVVTPLAICPVANLLPLLVAGGEGESASSRYHYYQKKQILKNNKAKIKEFLKEPIFNKFYDKYEPNVGFVDTFKINNNEDIDYKIKISKLLNDKFKNVDFNYQYENTCKYIMCAVTKNNYDFFETLLNNNSFSPKEIVDITYEAGFAYKDKSVDLIGINGIKNGELKKYRSLRNDNFSSDFYNKYNTFKTMYHNGATDEEIKTAINKSSKPVKCGSVKCVPRENVKLDIPREDKLDKVPGYRGLKTYFAGVKGSYHFAYSNWYEQAKFREMVKYEKKLTRE